jgi:drug/metabolite transporter (DMT)-like permease
LNNGVVFALLAYAVYSCSDAAIKMLSGQLGVFQIGFFIFLFAGLTLLPTRPNGERWLDAWRMSRPWAVQARALTGIVSGAFSVLAFTTIPFAEAYAIIFLSPFFVTLMSIVFLKEQVGPWRWASLVAGFIGVLLVVRPGFRELEIGHLAALIVALLAAVSVILSRSLAGAERHTSIIGAVIIYGLVFNAIGAVATGGLYIPPVDHLRWLLLAGFLSAGGQVFLLRATQLIPASLVAPTHYSQIVWGIVLGAAFFEEYPDWIAIAGLVVVGASGLLTVIRERIRRVPIEPARIDRL